MLYLITAEASEVDPDTASALMSAAKAEWDDIPFSEISTAGLAGCQPTAGDGIVFFNPARPQIGEDLDALIAEAARTGAVLLPIAMDSGHRRPAGAAGEMQSFDVVDQLRRRELPEGSMAVLGAAFAREALAATQPTFVLSRLRIFLCHRRSDGETLTAELDQALSSRHEHVFRDLIDIQVGEQAQERIEEALVGADVLVLLDTQDAGNSWWVAHELETALGRNIPVVWVRLPGNGKDRTELSVRPAADPHIVLEEERPSKTKAGALADEILLVAVRLARQHARTSLQALRQLKRWAAEQDASIEVLDARQMIFQLRHPPAPGRRAYPVRPASDVLQFFGRAPAESDHTALEEFLAQRGMGPHDLECRTFDAAILLDPTATGHRNSGEWSVTEHPERYLSYLAPEQRAGEEHSPRLLLLGAFPSGDYARDRIVPAVHATATTWLRLGGSIVCGGHPTFVPLLAEAARGILGEHGPERLIVFQSEWFVAPAQLEELQQHATVMLTERRGTRAESLTVMRNRMNEEGGASAVVAIGGRTDEGGTHVPGIDEEIALARAQGLPVYLFGAPGGQATILATRAGSEFHPWATLGNGLEAKMNELLLSSEDYERATRMIWDASTE
jgi:hypothetical protein